MTETIDEITDIIIDLCKGGKSHQSQKIKLSRIHYTAWIKSISNGVIGFVVTRVKSRMSRDFWKSLSGLPDFWRELQWNHYDLARETNVNFTKQNSNNCQSFSKNIWMGSGNIASFFKKHEIAELKDLP